MMSSCWSFLSYVLVLSHVCLVVQSSSAQTLGNATRLQSNFQDLSDIGSDSSYQQDDSEVLHPKYQKESTNGSEGRYLDINPTFYQTMFSNSLRSLSGSMHLVVSNDTTVTGIHIHQGYFINLAVSALAALGSGIAAIISVILVPLRVANQILAIIALALLAAYLVEDKHALKHIAGSNHKYKGAPVYTSHYGYGGAGILHRNDFLDLEDDDKLGVGEEEVLREDKKENKEEKKRECYPQ